MRLFTAGPTTLTHTRSAVPLHQKQGPALLSRRSQQLKAVNKEGSGTHQSSSTNGHLAPFYEQPTRQKPTRPAPGLLPPSETGRGAVVGLVLGGGPNDYQKLFPLTQNRALPAVPVAGSYRLVDIPISNLINSGITKMYIITQFNSQSLNRYLTQTYARSFHSTASGRGSFVEVLSVSQNPNQARWSLGTADSVRQFLWIIDDVCNRRDVSDIIILPADQLYRTDFSWLCEMHRANAADITVLCQPVSEEMTAQMGVCKVESVNTGLSPSDKAWWIVDYKEKPKEDANKEGFAMAQEQLRQFKKTSVKAAAAFGDPRVADQTSIEIEEQKHTQPDARNSPFIGSTGIYIFRRSKLVEILENKPDLNDFGKEVIPYAVESGEYNVQAVQMEGSWVDVGGSVKEYYDASMAIANAQVFDIMEYCGTREQRGISANATFFDPIAFKQHIYQLPNQLPPARCYGSKVSRSLISSGVTVGDKARVEGSIIGLRSVIGEGAVVQDSVLMGADYYEHEVGRTQQDPPVTDNSPAFPPMGIGAGSVIKGVILDKNVRVGKHCQLINKDGLYNSMNYASTGVFIREGIIVVAKSSVIQDGTII